MPGSLREQLEENFPEAVEQTTQAPEAATPSAADTSPPAGAETAGATPAPDKPEAPPKGAGRTAGRARDEHGKLLPGKADPAAKTSATAPATATPTAEATAAAPAPVAETVKPITRPTTWKKETWALWDKVNKGEALTAAEARQFAEEAARRDGDYSKGVSTYKGEFDRAKPILDVVNANQTLFQQHGIDPAQQFAKYIDIHKGLALGTPQQRLGIALQLFKDYNIPVQQLFARGEDGQIYFNPQVQPHQPQPQQAQPQVDPRVAVRSILAEERAAAEIEAAANDKEKYPHFEEVRVTMGQLLDAGVATDLPTLYRTALALPQFEHLTAADRQQAQAAQDAAQRAQAQAAVGRAKANAVSTRSQTPAGAASTSKATGLRGQLEENANAIFAGRV